MAAGPVRGRRATPSGLHAVRSTAARTLADAAGSLSRRLGRGGGTALPGRILLALSPDAVEGLSRSLADGAVVVSATNGKTTTTRLIVAAAEADGRVVSTNRAGSNLLRGVATTLLADRRRRPRPSLGVFEVDEAALPSVLERVDVRVVVLMNLFRDQLDRYGELENLVTRWRHAVSSLDPGTRIVANADDPAVATIAARHDLVTWFGIDDPRVGRDSLPHAADAVRCRTCGSRLVHDLVTVGHLGHWRCPEGHERRPDPDVSVTRVGLHGVERVTATIAVGSDHAEIDVALPGLHNVYNVAAALATAHSLGIGTDVAAAAIDATPAAFGRAERISVADTDLVILLAKNPTGANENVRTVASTDGPLHLLISLNDRTADGRDVSWIWDVDWEPILGRAAHVTVTGDRAHDLALRFRYADTPPAAVTVEPSVSDALDSALAHAGPGGTLYALPTYTAMLDLRAELVRRGVVDNFWADR
ncbi:MAG: MurT ligase domain-containing protein [Acidimicrobiales bacterium]